VKLTSASPTAEPWLQILLKLLDWPFLLCLFLVLFALVFRRQFEGLLNRGFTLKVKDFELTVEKKIEAAKQEVREEVAQDLDPVRDELDAMKERTSPAPNAPLGATVKGGGPATAETGGSALSRMEQALEDPRYRWRSVERLSHLAGVSEADALEILRSDPNVVLSRGKSGRQIARLKSR
jgi:hypothetical protein